MSLSPPTTQALTTTIVSQVESKISQTVPLLPKAFTRVLAKAIAGVSVLLYKYCGFIFLQLFVRWASFRPTTINGRTITPLIEWGRLIGVGDPEPAIRAELVVDIVVHTQGGTLPANKHFVRASTGVVYRVLAPVSLNAATVQASIRAVSDQAGGGGAGAIGNLVAGDIVDIASPIDGLATTATVASETTAGVDAETEESYRDRVFTRFQRRPQGGAYADYWTWATEVAGIINAYPYTADLPLEIDMYCEADEASSGSSDGIPTAGQLQAVRDSIDLDVSGLATRRPVNAVVNVYAISRTAFDVSVVGLIVEDVAGTQAEIDLGVDEYLRSREPFIVGLSVLPRQDRITSAALAGIVDTIVHAAGGSVQIVELLSGGEPIPTWTLDDGEKAKLGTVIYT